MQAILFDQPGEPEVMYLGEAAAPPCGPDEVRILVRATAVNRADTMQRRGLYPPPPGASTLLGLEAAGEISELGSALTPATSHLRVGQRVMALLAGGGYAAEVVVPSAQVMPSPAALTDPQAAAIPEAFLTAYLNLFVLGGLEFPAVGAAPPAQNAEKMALIHGGASGVGTAALQLLRVAGVRSYCTVGADDRAQSCRDLGAAAAWNYHATDFVSAALTATEKRGIDVVLDCVGASYLARNLRLLGPDGRLVCIGLQGGNRAELDLSMLLSRRIQVIGSTLRPLPLQRKAALIADFAARALPRFDSGELRPIVDRILPLSQAPEAHRALDGHHIGKIVMTV